MDSALKGPVVYKNSLEESDKSKCNTHEAIMDNRSNIVHKLFNREVSFMC